MSEAEFQMVKLFFPHLYSAMPYADLNIKVSQVHDLIYVAYDAFHFGLCNSLKIEYKGFDDLECENVDGFNIVSKQLEENIKEGGDGTVYFLFDVKRDTIRSMLKEAISNWRRNDLTFGVNNKSSLKSLKGVIGKINEFVGDSVILNIELDYSDASELLAVLFLEEQGDVVVKRIDGDSEKVYLDVLDSYIDQFVNEPFDEASLLKILVQSYELEVYRGSKVVVNGKEKAMHKDLFPYLLMDLVCEIMLNPLEEGVRIPFDRFILHGRGMDDVEIRKGIKNENLKLRNMGVRKNLFSVRGKEVVVDSSRILVR